jgi:hypothetical protein
VELIALFAAPLNSSHQFVVHVTEPVAGVVPHCAAADFGSAEKRAANTETRVMRVIIGLKCEITELTSAEIESQPVD